MLYPHSLSYHERSFIILSPIAIVWRGAKIEECVSPTKSIETRSSGSYPRIPLRLVSAASFIAAFTSSAVAGFSSTTVRSTTETSGVGTRSANPLSLPLSSGMTSAIAFAAPVLVGMMESAAALPRERFLCGKSSVFWSFV